MKLLLRTLLVLLIPLLFACNACKSLPDSAYGKAQAAKDKIEPLVMIGLVIVAEQETSAKAETAFNALSRVLDAWREADQGRFNAAVPCAAAALDDMLLISPAEARRSLRALQSMLRALSDGAACLPPKDAGSDEDAGSARIKTGGNPLAAWRAVTGYAERRFNARAFGPNLPPDLRPS